MQGFSPPLNLSKSEKQQFIERITKEFYSSTASSSALFLLDLQEKYKGDKQMLSWLSQMNANNKDDRYGIMTLTLDHSPSNLEFRLKRPEAYGGPKTENYLDRIDLKIEAAKQWVSQHPNMDASTKKEKLKYLEDLCTYFKQQISEDCFLDPVVLKKLSIADKHAAIYFKTQHKKATKHLAMFMDMLVEEINIDAKKTTRIKNELYAIEQDLMSKQRPERITARRITFGSTNYFEICKSTPVNKTQTISSAKKTTAGVANWIDTTTQIFSNNFELLDTRESYRSASIIPHDIINRGDRNFSNNLAEATAKRNLLEHIIPELVKVQKEKLDETGEALPLVLDLNFEMLTLLSPISATVDRVADPDYAQFIAIRNAFNHYNDRMIDVNVDGASYKIKLHGTYHNYGTNPGRGWSGAEEKVNKKAFNELLERSLDTLSKNKDQELQSLKDLLINNLPTFSKSEMEIISRNKSTLNEIYHTIDINNQKLNQEDHKQLLALHEKNLTDQSLNAAEQSEYERLKKIFDDIQQKNATLEKTAASLEDQILDLHTKLYHRRGQHLATRLAPLDAMLNKIESQYHLKGAEYRETVQHVRALHEYVKLSYAGYDSALGIIIPFATSDEKRNEKNYAIQSYIAMLNRFNGVKFHKTCKSGKDRTNSAEEKEKAKNFVRLFEGKVPKFEENAKEERLFREGFLQGPGNDICGDNMKPGAQQVSQGDIPTYVNIGIVKKMASLQKGIDALPPPSSKARQTVEKNFLEYRKQRALSTTTPDSPPKSTDSVKKISPPKRVQPLFLSTQSTEVKNSQKVMQSSGNNVDSLVKHLKEKHEECKYGGEPIITAITNQNLLKSFDIHLQVPEPHGTKFNASDTPQQNGINYSVSKKDKFNESTVATICRVAVDMATRDSQFDLTHTPTEIQEKMYFLLDTFINEKFTQGEKPIIIGYTPPKISDAKLMH